MIKNISGKTILLLVFVFFISFVLVACDSPSSSNDTSTDPERYQLSFNSLGEGSLPDLDGEYDEESSVEISAQPEEGWVFYKWEGEGIKEPGDASTTLLVSGDQEINAIFIEDYDGYYNDDGFAGWEGTEDKPFLIKNAEQINNIRNGYFDSYFYLIDDINLEDLNDWLPIGSADNYEDRLVFKGFIDGRNYSINNLYINNENANNVGLFYRLDGAEIINIEIKGEMNILEFSGLLAGEIIDSNLFNVTVRGEISGDNHVGGLAGYIADSRINDSGAYVEMTGMENIGGIAGFIENSEILTSYVNVDISATGRHIGGIAGVARDTDIVDCLSSGKLYTSAIEIYDGEEDIQNADIGGIVGGLYEGVFVNHAVSYADIKGEGYSVGGIAGQSSGEIINSEAHGTVMGVFNVGGLIGINENTVKYSFATGKVVGERDVGGLIGYNYNSKIEDNYSTGNVFGHRHVGGLVGFNSGIISKSFAEGNVDAEGDDDNTADVGGLVGFHESGEIKNSYATGDITSRGNHAGGLIGQIHGTLENSFAVGSVEGDSRTGGLIGWFHEPENPEVSNSYYDKENTGQSDDEGKGFPKTTNEMLQQATFEPEWDFDNIWQIDEGSSYPYFQWQSNNIPRPYNLTERNFIIGGILC